MSFTDSTKAVWIVVALLLPIFTSLVQVESAPCDNYTVQPPDPPVLYAIQGRNTTLEAFIQGYDTIWFYNRTNSRQRIDCTERSIMCHLDQDSGVLTFINFKSMYAGEYELEFAKTLQITCTYQFNLTEAVPPTLTDSDSTKTINADSGPLTFSPTVFPGVPPGEVQWYKDGVNISVGNTFTLSKVMASDRGVYTANITNPAGRANVTYTLLVNFPPIITITATQIGLQDYKITCTAIAYPRIGTIELIEDRNGVRTVVQIESITRSSTVSETFNYEASAEYSGSNNCPVVYYCFVNTSFHDRTESNGTCQTTPNVTNFRVNETGSTNTTAYLTWTLEPKNILVAKYLMEYRKTGSNAWTLDDDTCQPSTKYCIIPSLDPGTLYEFRLVARNSVGTGAVSSVQSYHTRSAPKNKPIGVAAERTIYNDNYDTIKLSWQDVPASSYADVSSYQIVFYTDTNRTLGYINDIALPPYLFNKMINRSHTYFFRVRANNTWGLGPHSALIESMKTNVDDPYQGQISVTTTLEVSDDTVVVSWVLSGESHITSIGITIDEITIETSSSSTTVTTRRIYNYNVNGVRSSRKCFSGLDSSNRYKFCVVATSRTGLNKSDCVTVSTTSSGMNIDDATDCQNIQPISDGPAIPPWSIGVIVAGAVLLVFFVFGGCGLYYGIKRNKKGGTDFDSPHPSVDDINGYPYPAKRVPSPSRSCMSYRHNQQHQHGLEWRTTNPLGRQDSIPGVTSV